MNNFDAPKNDFGDLKVAEETCLESNEMGENSSKKAARDEVWDRLMAKPIWDEVDLALFFDVTVDTLRHMKSRGEIPAVVNINLRCWRVHRDAFFEHFKQLGMPKPARGRPPGTSSRPV